jgi:hypothetical protein
LESDLVISTWRKQFKKYHQKAEPSILERQGREANIRLHLEVSTITTELSLLVELLRNTPNCLLNSSPERWKWSKYNCLSIAMSSAFVDSANPSYKIFFQTWYLARCSVTPNPRIWKAEVGRSQESIRYSIVNSRLYAGQQIPRSY